MTGFRYKAFISYSHKDEAVARWVHRALEAYSLPRGLAGAAGRARSLSPIFRDQEELVASSDLSDAIVGALRDSEFLIVICSPAARTSHWVEQEIATFKELRTADNVIAVLADGTAATSFPRSLSQDLQRDGSYSATVREPLAADMQGGRRNRRLALHKLVAAMLQLELDQLVQRDYRRRVRILGGVAVAATLSMLVMGWLTLTAVKERRNALIARASAEESARLADQRRRQSEELISFMVGDLRESLRPLGKLALLDRVGDKAVTYFESLDRDAVNDQSLMLHAEVLTQVGEIRMWQFQYQPAIEVFEQAYQLADTLVQRNIDDGERLFRRSQAEYWLGDMHWRSNNLDEAERWLRRYQESSLSLYGLDSTRLDWQMEVAYGHHNLAVLEIDRGELSLAKELFARELEILNRLEEQGEGVEDVRFNLSDTYSWLGKIALREGDLSAAQVHFDESGRYISQLLTDDPDDSFLTFYFVVASGFSAEVRALTGQVREAEVRYENLLERLSPLVQADEENIQQMEAHARMTIDVAELALSSAAEIDWSDALARGRAGVEVLRSLHEQEPEDRRTLFSLVKGLRVLAELHLMRGASEKALSLAREALGLNPGGDAGLEFNRELGGSLALAREALAADVEPVGLVPGLRDLEEVFLTSASDTYDPLTRDAYARLLAQAGQVERAMQIRNELEGAGYRPLRPWREN